MFCRVTTSDAETSQDMTEKSETVVSGVGNTTAFKLRFSSRGVLILLIQTRSTSPATFVKMGQLYAKSILSLAINCPLCFYLQILFNFFFTKIHAFKLDSISKNKFIRELLPCIFSARRAIVYSRVSRM